MHLLDGGYVDAKPLVTAQSLHQIDVVGPPFGPYSHQRRAGEGYDLGVFLIDWETQQVRCPQGQTSLRWTPGRDVSGDPVVHIRFHGACCRACPVRQACTRAKNAPRQLTMQPQAQHEAIQAARQRQETAAFTAHYAQRAGIEGTQSQAVRRCGARQCRYIGQAKTHLQHVLTAAALNLVRVEVWLEDTPRARTRQSAFAALAA
jgi:transposase